MDILTLMVFDPRYGADDRWREAQQTGFDKGIRRAVIAEACSWQKRTEVFNQVMNREYRVTPPHVELIPKKPSIPPEIDQMIKAYRKDLSKQDDTQTFLELLEKISDYYRAVFASGGFDRILFRVINQVLFEVCGKQMIHPACVSYQRGISCGDIVTDIAKTADAADDVEVGFKSDIRHYFDNVAIEHIEKVWDDVERITGASPIIDLLRTYYRSTAFYGLQPIDRKGKPMRRHLLHHFQSLRQGCAVAAFLADAVLKPLDEMMASRLDIYVRYSDDQVGIGKDWRAALRDMQSYYESIGLSIHPKKLQTIRKSEYFTFLGFSVKGRNVSIDEKQLHLLTTDVAKYLRGKRNAKGKWINPTYKQMLRHINQLLYNPMGEFSTARYLLRAINNTLDLDIIDRWLKDVLRCCQLRHYKMSEIGGIGYVSNGNYGCLERGRGSYVTTARKKTDEVLQGYRSLLYMQGLLHASRSVYDAEVRKMAAELQTR